MGGCELLSALADEITEGRWQAQSDGVPSWVSRLESRPALTVVVPIYDGLAHLRRLLRCSALWREAETVLLIDDCSTDPRVTPLLADAARAHANAKLARNRRNLGFVRTVNAGLEARAPGSDVLVLNSDTVLGRGWAAALGASAYAYGNVATVSPLSNGAGFFSVPNANRLNDVPPGWAVEDCSRLLSWIAPAMHEEAPATCGFCWYVRGDALDSLGALDEMMFLRGYAEETDFCLRAADAGLKNLCQLTHYVEHAGGESFTTEKISLKRTNARVLGAMQPTFLERLVAYEARSVIPSLGARFAAATNGPARPAGPASRAADLTIHLASKLECEADESTLGIEVGEAHLQLRLGAHAASVTIDPRHWTELLAYLVLRLRPNRLVDETALVEPLAERAAAVVGAELGRRGGFTPGMR